MRLPHLLQLAFAASVSAQSLTTVLANNNATLSTLTSTKCTIFTGQAAN